MLSLRRNQGSLKIATVLSSLSYIKSVHQKFNFFTRLHPFALYKGINYLALRSNQLES